MFQDHSPAESEISRRGVLLMTVPDWNIGGCGWEEAGSVLEEPKSCDGRLGRSNIVGSDGGVC